MKKIKAVIFDIDGLMIDSEAIQTQSFEHVLKEYGKEPKRNELGVVHTVGAGAIEIWKTLKEQYEINESEEMLSQKSKTAYLKIFNESFNIIKPLPGLCDLLELLHTNKIKLAVATGGSHEYIQMVLQNLGISKYFDVLVSGWDVKRHKPYPDIYFYAAKKLALKPTECLVLEDAESGVIAAHDAGMKVIAVPNRYTKTHNFSKANKIVPSLKSITMSVLKKYSA